MSEESELTKIRASKELADIVEQRYAFVIWLYRIKKQRDKKIEVAKDKEEIPNMSVFAEPAFIKEHFGGFLRTPLYTKIASLEGHT